MDFTSADWLYAAEDNSHEATAAYSEFVTEPNRVYSLQIGSDAIVITAGENDWVTPRTHSYSMSSEEQESLNLALRASVKVVRKG